MDANHINVTSALINAGAILVLMTAFFGITWKLSSILLAVFAYPVYLSLYAFELPQGSKKSENRRIFSLNIPKENPKKFFMNFSAFLVFLFMLPNVMSFVTAINLPPKEQASLIMAMLYGSEYFRVWFNGLALLFIGVIYAISYVTEEDKRDPWEKIESLSIPSLWKSIIKKL